MSYSTNGLQKWRPKMTIKVVDQVHSQREGKGA